MKGDSRAPAGSISAACYASVAEYVADKSGSGTFEGGGSYSYVVSVGAGYGPFKTTSGAQVGGKLAVYWDTYYDTTLTSNTIFSDGSRTIKTFAANWAPGFRSILNQSAEFTRGGLACTTLLPEEPETLLVSLTGPTQTRPAGTGGTSELALTAKVMNGAAPAVGVEVTLSVDVTANSGGHDHHNASRPKGTVSPLKGITDANGEVKVIFKPSEIAGTHTIKAACASCTNSPVSKEIQVKVSDLLNIFAVPYRDAQWAYPGIGAVTGQHSDQHYLTVAAATRMLEISQKFKKIWPNAPKLTLNDASLVWGGKFDLPGTWEKDPQRHNEHRLGDNIDIRANSSPGAVPSNIRDVVFRWLHKASRPKDKIAPEFVIESVNTLREGIGMPNEHFHLRLGN